MFPFDRPLIRTLPPPAEVPLAQGDLRRSLVAAFVFNEPTAGLRDRVSGVKAVGFFPGATGTARRYAEPDVAYGQGLYLDGSYVTWQPGASRSPFQLSGAFSVASGGSFQTRDTVAGYHWSLFDAARTLDITLYSYAGTLYLRIDGVNYSLGINADTEYDGGTPRRRADTCVAWSAASGSADTYIRGALKTSTAITTPPTDLGANPYLTLGTSSGLSTTESIDGVHAYLYVFNRKLTSAEARQIADIVWCLFPPQPGLIWVPPSAGGGGIAGVAAPTLADATLAATAVLQLAGTATPTLGATTASATGTLAILGDVSLSLADATLAATGTSGTLGGTLSSTLADVTLSGSSTLNLAGQTTATLGDATLAATGALALAGTLTNTLEAVQLGAASKLNVVGTASATLADVTLLSSGASGAVGALSATLADVALSSTSAIALAGSLVQPLATVTLASTGVLPIKGTLNSALDATTVVASGMVGSVIAGALSATLGDAALSSSAKLAIAGQTTAQLAPVTLSSAALLALAGQVNATLGNATLVAAASKLIEGSSSITLGDCTIVATGVALIVEDVIYARIPADNVPLVRGARPDQLSSARRRN